MQLLTATFQVCAAVVLVGGVAKIASPDGFAELLRSLRLPGGRAAATVSGLVEIVLGAAGLLIGGRASAALIALAYASFAMTVVWARRNGAESCGCFGSTSAPPSTVHAVLNAVSCAVAATAAIVGTPALLDVLEDQPLLGLPYLAALVLATWLVVVIDTDGSRLADELHRSGSGAR